MTPGSQIGLIHRCDTDEFAVENGQAVCPRCHQPVEIVAIDRRIIGYYIVTEGGL